ADSRGEMQVFHRGSMWKLLPAAALSMAADIYIFLLSWVALQILRLRMRVRQDWAEPTARDSAFLYPFPMDRAQSGGAMSHVTGFRSGLSRCAADCTICSGGAVARALVSGVRRVSVRGCLVIDAYLSALRCVYYSCDMLGVCGS